MRKFFVVFLIWFYIFFLFGLIFHTSYNKEQIFEKYSLPYFLLIILVFLAFIPFIWFLKYIRRSSQILISKKKFKLTPRRKVLAIFLVIIFVIASAEIFMRANDIHTRRTVYNMEFHPFLQNKLRPSIGAEFHHNSYGFRNEEIKKEKEADTFRIVILGGSTAYGVRVSYENNSAKLLEDMLRKQYKRKIEVINAAVSGYTTEHTVIDYLFRISDFKPDLVIMWHGVNDLYASCADPKSLAGPYQPDYSHFYGPIANMVATYFEPSIVSIHLDSLDYVFGFLKTHLYSDFAQLYEGFSSKAIEYNRSKIPAKDMQFPSISSYQRNLTYFISAVRSDNSQLIIGNQPNMFGTDVKYKLTQDGIFCYNGEYKATVSSEAKAMTAFNQVTKVIAEENNVPFIDLDSFLPRTTEYFFDNVHWTEKGHMVIAKKLYQFIIQENFISD